MAAIFEFYAKIAKHKNANISKTVLDGELSLKSIADSQFFIHLLLEELSHGEISDL